MGGEPKPRGWAKMDATTLNPILRVSREGRRGRRPSAWITRVCAYFAFPPPWAKFSSLF